MVGISRRRFLSGSAATAALFGADRRPVFPERPDLPRPHRTGLTHVVVATMENRSFDHLLGWLPGADGRQAGLVYTDATGVPHATHPLAPDFQGCGHADPDHSWAGGRVAFDGGACDGWLRAGANDAFAIGYYTQDDLSFFGQAAPDWTVCDRYFAPMMGPTFPNRLYLNAGATDRLENTGDLCTLPTIWDRLQDAGLEGRYYSSSLPFVFLSLWGSKYRPITRSYDEFLADCATGRLPTVAFVDAPSAGESSGESSDDHPFGDVRAGEAWLAETYRAVTRSPAWPRTLLVITFDEWGGFFDHVPPSVAPDVEPAHALRGFRVPCLLVSPWTRYGGVISQTFDHTSILRMIESRWSLRPLSVRDAAASNLAQALDFSDPDFFAPDYAVPPLVSLRCP
ncbi:MAG TPA: alkaline phosphatase family protein [Thermoanaerobaculia bacterium]